MTYNRAEALERARASTTYPAGMCLQWVRKMYGIAARFPDASSAWRGATKRHPDDRTPPIGAPVFWTGGRKGHGHVAIYVGNGKVRGTDSPTKGRIGTVDLGWVEKAWGLTYEGWTEDLNGVTIPTAPRPVVPSPGAQAAAPLELIAYNAKAHRGARAGADVARIIDTERPHVLVVLETAGNQTSIRRAAKALYRAPITGKGADGSSTWLLVRKDVPLDRWRLLVTRVLWRGPKGGRRVGRTLPAAVVRYRGRAVAVAGIHMQWNPEKNAAAWDATHAQLVAFGRALKGPFAMIGDWNHRDSATSSRSATQLAKDTRARVVPTGARVDYAVVRGMATESIVLPRLKGGSDHVPIRVRLTFPTSKENSK